MWRLPKEGYFFLRSQWTDKPMVHIVGHWTPNAGKNRRTVRVYSNADTVELTLNDSSLGTHEAASPGRAWKDFKLFYDQFGVEDEFSKSLLAGAKLQHGPFIWDDVPFEPGRLVAIARKGATTVRDEQRTPHVAARILLHSEKAALDAGGEDVSFIEADVVDDAGAIVWDARPWIHFDVIGPGHFLGEMVDIDAISGVAAPAPQKLMLVLDALSKIEIRVFALDEVNFTEVGTAAKQKRLLNALRYLANELRISIVCLGTEEMMRVIRSVPSVEKPISADGPPTMAV